MASRDSPSEKGGPGGRSGDESSIPSSYKGRRFFKKDDNVPPLVYLNQDGGGGGRPIQHQQAVTQPASSAREPFQVKRYKNEYDVEIVEDGTSDSPFYKARMAQRAALGENDLWNTAPDRPVRQGVENATAGSGGPFPTTGARPRLGGLSAVAVAAGPPVSDFSDTDTIADSSLYSRQSSSSPESESDASIVSTTFLTPTPSPSHSRINLPLRPPIPGLRFGPPNPKIPKPGFPGEVRRAGAVMDEDLLMVSPPDTAETVKWSDFSFTEADELVPKLKNGLVLPRILASNDFVPPPPSAIKSTPIRLAAAPAPAPLAPLVEVQIQPPAAELSPIPANLSSKRDEEKDFFVEMAMKIQTLTKALREARLKLEGN